MNVTEIGTTGWLEEIPLADSRGAEILVVYGDTTATFAQAVNALTDPKINNQLHGSLVACAPDGYVKGVQSTVAVANSNPFGGQFEWKGWLGSGLLLLAPLIAFGWRRFKPEGMAK
jgi:hypothetical protein